MKIVFTVDPEGSTTENIQELISEFMVQCDRMKSGAHTDAMRQKTIKEARYYEGKAKAFQDFREFLEAVHIA